MLTLLELVHEYGSLQFGLDALLAATAPLRRRYYSISSGPAAAAGASSLACCPKLSITVGVVEESRAGGLPAYHGVCSWTLGHTPGVVKRAMTLYSARRAPTHANLRTTTQTDRCLA